MSRRSGFAQGRCFHRWFLPRWCFGGPRWCFGGRLSLWIGGATKGWRRQSWERGPHRHSWVRRKCCSLRQWRWLREMCWRRCFWERTSKRRRRGWWVITEAARRGISATDTFRRLGRHWKTKWKLAGKAWPINSELQSPKPQGTSAKHITATINEFIVLAWTLT